MEDIRIYDTDFNLCHIENNVISSNWTVHFNSVGNFEIHTLANTDTAEIILSQMDISENRLPIIVQGDLQGVVTGVRLSDDFAIYGRTLNWFLARKIVPKFISRDLPVVCNPEDIANYLVLQAFSDQKNFVTGDKAGLLDIDTFWRNTYNPLNEVVSDVLAIQNAGHRVVFDLKNKCWVFEILPPTESKILLSEANLNAFGSEYTYSIDGYCSACWYEQEQDFVNGEFLEPVWTKLVKDKKVGIFSSEYVASATVESEAKSLLDAKKVKSEIVTGVNGLLFGEDFGLGDILRVQFINGKIARTEWKQISGVNLGWENGSESREIILKDI